MTDPVSPAAYDPAETPAVFLNGQFWPIPPLGWRALSRSRSQILELSDRLRDALLASPAPEGESADAKTDREMAAMDQLFLSLSNEDYDRLVMGVLFTALTVAHPALTREALDAWPMTEGDRLRAWFIVRRQSGLFLPVAPGATAADPEPQAGNGQGAS